MSDYRRGFEFVIGFVERLHSVSEINDDSLKITVSMEHIKFLFYVFSSNSCLVTDPNNFFRSHVHTSWLLLYNSLLAGCPAYNISARIKQKTPFHCCFFS
jgi:hypothetical protein